MSEPITDVLRVPADPDAGEARPLGRFLTPESEPALAHFLDLLRVLDERGVLRIVRDLVDRNEEIVRVLVEWATRPSNVRAVQGLEAMLHALQRVEPERLERIGLALDEGIARASQIVRDRERRGAISVLRQLGEPEVNQGLRIVLEFLKALAQPPPAPKHPEGTAVKLGESNL